MFSKMKNHHLNPKLIAWSWKQAVIHLFLQQILAKPACALELSQCLKLTFRKAFPGSTEHSELLEVSRLTYRKHAGL